MAGQAPFVRDDPESLDADAFGHRDYADALVSVLTGGSPPPTIGIFGPWGVGKSTIIGGVQKRLQDSAVSFVYFDAWRYEGDSLRRQFLTEAAKQLDADGRLGSYDLEDELRELDVDTQELRETFSWSRERFKRAVVLGLLFALIALAAALLGAFPALLGGKFGTKILAALTIFSVTALASALSQSVVVKPTTLTRRTLQDPDRFAAKFTKLLRSLKTQRVVIAIDNLDRCSPEKAVEMLGTIKTYLEPAAGVETLPRSSATEAVAKDIVFVIAVDDEALRRHLVAQEQSRSVTYDEIAVRRYVDEYLAKFFNARLPIRPILVDDMRGYIDTHIRPLAESRSLDEDQTRTLIALVAGALRRNPRRVKQFSNDLEGRLRLFTEREREKDGKRGIDPPVSGEVVMIAKLALIETEWPDAFAQLQEDPRLLERWTMQAIGESEVDWHPRGELQRTEEMEGSNGRRTTEANAKSRRSFGDFLRLSATTDSKQLRAMLSLKQSQMELDLPGYSEFREAIVNGDRAAVAELLEKGDDEYQVRLAAGVPDLLRSELKAGYLDFARVIVDVVISIDAFVALESVRRQVLTVAVEDPALRAQLISLDPVLLLEQAGLLSVSLRQRLFEPFLGRLLDPELAEDLRQPVADAIGPWANDFSLEQEKRVRKALAEFVGSQFATVLPLARVAPALLTLKVTDAAIQALEHPRGQEPSPEEPRPMSEHPEAFEVLELGLRDPSINQELRSIQLVARIFEMYAQEPVIAEELPLYERLLRPLETRQEDVWAQLGRSIESRWSVVPTHLQAQVISLAGLTLERADETTRDEVSRTIAGLVFEDPARALALNAELKTPPSPLRDAFVAHLTTLAGQPDHWQEAGDALARIDGPDYPQWQINALHHLLANDQIEAAREMLGRFEGLFDEHPAQLVASINPVLVQRASSGPLAPAALVAKLSELSADEELDELAEAYVERLAGPDGPSVVDLFDQLREHGATRLRLSVTHRAISRLGSEPHPMPPALIDLACRNIDHLSAEDQRLLAAGLAVRLRTHLDQAPPIASQIMRIRAISATPAKELVSALIDAESAIGDLDSRRVLLGAANAIRGARKSRATKLMRTRLESLQASGDEADRELAESFLSLLDS